MAGNRTLKLSILADTDDLVKGLKKAEGETANAGNRIGDTFKKVGAAAIAAGAVVSAFAIKLGVDAVKAASDLGETLSKTNVLFGESSAAVVQFAESAAATFGQSKQQALDAASTFATFGRSAGLAGDDLVKFSTDFVGLASDLASFNNTSPEQAINAIGSALRGEAEPLRQFGVLLDDATLKNAALELGLISTTKNALTPQQKVLAAQKVIYEQTTAAQGDFARTSDGLANTQRILTAEFENIKVIIGTALLPVITNLFKFVNEKIIPAISEFAESFSQKATPFIDKFTKVVIDFVLPALRNLYNFIILELVPTIRNFFAPIIEVLISFFVKLKNVFQENEAGLQVFLGVATKFWEFVKGSLAPLISDFISGTLKILAAVVLSAVDAFFKLYEIVGKIARLVGIDLKVGFDKAKESANNLNSGIVDAYKSFGEQSKVIKNDLIPNLGSAISLTGALSGANAALSGSTKGAAAAQSALARELAALRAGGAIPGAISPELRDFYKSELSLISQFGGIIPGINQKPGDPFFGFGEGSRVGGAIRGFESGNTQVVNINVSGAIVDPAGAARAVADVLKNETARSGTLVLTPNFAVE